MSGWNSRPDASDRSYLRVAAFMPRSQSHVSARRDILAADCSATSEEKPAPEHFSVYMALRNPQTFNTDTHLPLFSKHLAQVISNKQQSFMFKRVGVSLGKITKPSKSEKHCIWPTHVCIFHLCFSKSINLKFWSCSCPYLSSNGASPRWKTIPRCINQLHWTELVDVQWNEPENTALQVHDSFTRCAVKPFLHTAHAGKEMRGEATLQGTCCFCICSPEIKPPQNTSQQMGTDVESWFGSH